jgi:FMN phosphatase YigB (HAD superfamily)
MIDGSRRRTAGGCAATRPLGVTVVLPLGSARRGRAGAPDRAVMLDDMPSNLAGAAAIGIHTILVAGDWDDAIGELEAFLGEQGRRDG